ncbi:MAG: flippase-like domain-containing protein [Chitinophagaceae bacterium]|nr:flippase-like domain-containing protein [Chitinophagaceae bacterium]
MFNDSTKGSHSEQKRETNPRYITWSFILFVMVFGFVVYYFAEIKKEFTLLEEVKPIWLIVAIIAQLITYIFTAAIYRLLLAPYKLRQRPRLAGLTRASVISLFFNQTMPSAGISGNTFFLNFLLRFGINVSDIISLIITELLIFYAAMEVLILVLLFSCLFFVQTSGIFTATLIGGLIVYLLFAIAVVLSGRKKVIYKFIERIGKIKILKSLAVRIKNRISPQLLEAQEIKPLIFIRKNQLVVFRSFSLQLFLVIADAFTIYALFSGLGISVSPFSILLCYMCTRIISILPFLPGALILYESSMSYFFAATDVPVASAIIVTLLYRLLSYWLPMPVGFLLYKKWSKQAK